MWPRTVVTHLLNVMSATRAEPVRRQENQRNHPEMYGARQVVGPRSISARFRFHQKVRDEQADRTEHLWVLLHHLLPAQAHGPCRSLHAYGHLKTFPPPSPSSP